MTATEWWKLFEAHQEDLRNLVVTYHPDARYKNKFPITAMSAESACQFVRKQIRRESNITLSDRFTMAVVDHNIDTLIRLFNEAWFGMPESTEVRREPGFFVLCELCEGIEEE